MNERSIIKVVQVTFTLYIANEFIILCEIKSKKVNNCWKSWQLTLVHSWESKDFWLRNEWIILLIQVLNESVQPLHKTILNDLLTNQTSPVLKIPLTNKTICLQQWTVIGWKDYIWITSKMLVYSSHKATVWLQKTSHIVNSVDYFYEYILFWSMKASVPVSCIWLFANTHPHSLLCLTIHTALKPHIMFSSSEKYIVEQRQNWQSADRQDTAGYFWYKTSVSFQIV